jgi:hypothetical protein
MVLLVVLVLVERDQVSFPVLVVLLLVMVVLLLVMVVLLMLLLLVMVVLLMLLLLVMESLLLVMLVIVVDFHSSSLYLQEVFFLQILPTQMVQEAYQVCLMIHQEYHLLKNHRPLNFRLQLY